MVKQKVEDEKFVITQAQIDEIIGNISGRFLLKAKAMLKEDLVPLPKALADKFKSFEKKNMKFVNGKWEFAGEDWEDFKKRAGE